MARKTQQSASSNLQLAAQRIGMREVLITPGTEDAFLSNLSRFGQIGLEEGQALEVASRQSLEAEYCRFGVDEDRDERKPFVFHNGVAVIPIHGTLINRFNSSWGFVTGYNFIRRQHNLALDDDDVELIVFDVDSPGGEAAGNFELAREIMAGRRVKPSLAMVDSVAASGGIALAVAASKVYAMPSARLGSIGVYRMHISIEDALKNEGVKVTFASAGDHKVDGNPYQDLPDSVLKDWTESAGKTWDDFISLVAEARGLDDVAVRDTQARIYRADEALDLGLIDRVKTTSEAVSAFVAELAEDAPSTDDEENAMTDKTKGSEATSTLSAAEIASIAAAAATEATQKVLGGFERRQQIKDYAAAKGKGFEALGAQLAADENISFESAKGIIDAAAPAVSAPAAPAKGKKGQKVQTADDGDEGDDDENEDEDEDGDAGESARSQDRTNHFAATMDNVSHPNVGAGTGKGKRSGEEMSDEDLASSILADAAAGGASWAKSQKAA